MSRRGSRERGGSSGCMSGVLHLLHIHRLLFTSNGGGGEGGGSKRTCRSAMERHRGQELDRLKGTEAPRNSLEKTEESGMSSLSFFHGEYFEVPLGIQIKRTSASARLEEICKKGEFLPEEERRSSESTPRTTRNVVARLMGLDELPENAPDSPAIYSGISTRPPFLSTPTQHVASDARRHSRRTKTKKKDDEEPKATRRQSLQNRSNTPPPSSCSLPETPRGSASFSGRPWLDVTPRLSLQNFTDNKENVNPKEAMKGFTSFRNEAVFGENSKAPITRTNLEYYYQDDNVKHSSGQYNRESVKKAKERVVRRDSSLIDGTAAGKRRPTRTAPAPLPLKGVVVFQENGSTKNRSPPKKTKSFTEAINVFSATNEAVRDSKPTQPPPSRTPANTKTFVMKPNSKSKKARHERFTEKIARPSPTRSTVQMRPKIQTATICSMQENKKIVKEGDSNEQDEQLRYVKSIIERAGFSGDGFRKIKWHSPSQLLDPIIFHELELNPDDHHHLAAGEKRTAAVRHRWNRKLMFHLVGEILRDLLSSQRISRGEDLLRRLWETIRSFPTTRCKVVGDIDALVEGDLRGGWLILRHVAVAVEHEGAEMVAWVERLILDELVGEAAAELCGGVI